MRTIGRPINYKRKKYGGAVTVPQVSVPYTPQGGPVTDPNSQIATNLKTSTQGTANAQYDTLATVMEAPQSAGGRRKQNTKTKETYEINQPIFYQILY